MVKQECPVRNELSYYDIGTNVIMKTPGLDDKVYMLSDFQKVELDSGLYEKDADNVTVSTYNDTDEDGIIDRNELMSPINIDITEFVRKTLYADIFGKEETHLPYEEKIARNNHINVMLNQYKANVKSNFETARCNNEYEYEFYYDTNKDALTVTCWKYRSNPVLKDTDFDGIDDGIGIEEVNRLMLDRGVEIQSIPYIETVKDKTPLDNSFKGIMNTTRLSKEKGIEVDMTMDYRYFLMDNRLYYDELSTMSLLYVNSIYMKGKEQSLHSGVVIKDLQNLSSEGEEGMDIGGVRYKNLRVKDLMEFYGFQNVKVYYMGSKEDQGYDKIDNKQPYCKDYKDTHKGSVAIGYKNIEYHGIDKTVIGIVIRGTAEDDDWDSDFDMGDKELRDTILNNSDDVDLGHNNYDRSYGNIQTKLNTGVLNYDKQYSTELLHFAGGYPDWTHNYHHAGFDIVANRMLEIIEEYVDETSNKTNDDICFWITGHSMGGGVANLVAAELTSKGYKDQVYCYTFAAPNTFYLTDNTYERENLAISGEKVTENYREPHGSKYRCIFNVVNDDDFVPKLPMEECEWTKYGRTATVSFNSRIASKGKGLAVADYYGHYTTNHLDSNIGKYSYRDYNGSAEVCGNLINALNSIYTGYESSMRRNTYDFDKDSSYETIMSMYDSVVIGDYSKPYQRVFSNNYTFTQLQVPAYFLQSIAYAKHSGVLDSLIFKTKRFAPQYISARDKLIDVSVPWANKIMEFPHYLESYYVLTKENNTNDFR